MAENLPSWDDTTESTPTGVDEIMQSSQNQSDIQEESSLPSWESSSDLPAWEDTVDDQPDGIATFARS